EAFEALEDFAAQETQLLPGPHRLLARELLAGLVGAPRQPFDFVVARFAALDLDPALDAGGEIGGRDDALRLVKKPPVEIEVLMAHLVAERGQRLRGAVERGLDIGIERRPAWRGARPGDAQLAGRAGDFLKIRPLL